MAKLTVQQVTGPKKNKQKRIGAPATGSAEAAVSTAASADCSRQLIGSAMAEAGALMPPRWWPGGLR